MAAIGASFHAGANGLQWLINAYLLPLGALLLLGGAAGDFGPALVGGFGGGAAGAAAGSETGPGAVFTGAMSSGAGAMGLPEFIKQQYADEVKNGTYKGPEDFAARFGGVLWHTAQAGAVGAVTAGAGKYGYNQ